MGQCTSHSCIAVYDPYECMLPTPVHERAEKKRGGLFRWAFSRKSKKKPIKAQQGHRRNDSSQPPQRCSDGENEQKNNTQSINTPSKNNIVHSLNKAEECSDTNTSVYSGISSFCSVEKVKVDVPEAEENSKDDTFWKTEDEIINLSSNAKRGEICLDYKIGRLLGQGEFGKVHEGTRLSDSRKVALKYLAKEDCFENGHLSRFGKLLPNEVAMMIRVSKGPSVPQIIKLLDWYETPKKYILVIERPMPFKYLRQYLVKNGGRISESEARVVMHQVVTVARISIERGVFHGIIKPENLLINEKSLQVKLVNFGGSRSLKKSGYKRQIDTEMYAPPEAFHIGGSRYYAKPATVYSLGILLYVLLFGKYPYFMESWIFARTLKTADISKECKEMISSCMEKDPTKRIDLDKILNHDWFQVLLLKPESQN